MPSSVKSRNATGTAADRSAEWKCHHKEIEEEDIAAQGMLEDYNLKREEEKLKIKKEKKEKAAADTVSKEETKRTANAPTADA